MKFLIYSKWCNGADSYQFSEIAPQRAKTATWAKGLNRHFGGETALLNLQCTRKKNFSRFFFVCLFVCLFFFYTGKTKVGRSRHPFSHDP